MVLCIVAMVVFGFLGIFSAKYRTYAREAFRCVGRMATLRPCDTEFDEKMKSKITAKLMEKNEKLGKFTYRHFGKISAVFMVVFFVSLGYSAYSIYNLAVYGTCDPVTGQCIFNPQNPNQVVCPFHSLEPKTGVPTIGNFLKIPDAAVNITKPLVYFFGTTWCPHCGWEKPIFSGVVSKFGAAIDAKTVEVDLQATDQEKAIFQHYSPNGNIPTLIIGGKYFRIGSGEAIGEQAESNVLTALLCSATNNSISDCQKPEIQDLISRI